MTTKFVPKPVLFPGLGWQLELRSPAAARPASATRDPAGVGQNAGQRTLIDEVLRRMRAVQAAEPVPSGNRAGLISAAMAMRLHRLQHVIDALTQSGI
jgi:hypothetical protein